MTFKPAHKYVGDGGKPGQLSFDRYPYMKHSTADPRDERTLNEYIARKADDFDYFKPTQQDPVVKKLTFEEWLRQSSFVEPDAGTYLWLKDCWNAALTRGKVS